MNLLEYYLSIPDKIIVNLDEDTGLYCCRYNSLGMDWNDKKIRMARGIILDKNGNIVSKGYDKFFNYLELENKNNIKDKDLSRFDSEEFIVSEKIDGSMMLVTYYNNKLLVSSSSSINNEYTDLFNKKLSSMGLSDANTVEGAIFKVLLTSNCAVFEYVSPRTQIVLPYEEEEIILHGIISKETWSPVFHDNKNMKLLGKIFNFRVRETFEYSLDELIEKQKNNKNIEGWVVQFLSGKMIKFKTEWYLEKHDSASFFFGTPYTERKIGNAIDWYYEDIIDDYIAKANQRLTDEYSNALSKIIEKIKELENYFDRLIRNAKKIIDLGLKPKEYAEFLGGDTLDAQVYFMVYKNSYKLDTFKRKYIKEQVIKILKEENTIKSDLNLKLFKVTIDNRR